MAQPAIKAALAREGTAVDVSASPEQFAAFQAAEYARWKNLIESRKISAD